MVKFKHINCLANNAYSPRFDGAISKPGRNVGWLRAGANSQHMWVSESRRSIRPTAGGDRSEWKERDTGTAKTVVEMERRWSEGRESLYVDLLRDP